MRFSAVNWAPALLVALAIAVLSYPPDARAQRATDCGYYTYGRSGVSEGRHCAGAGQEAPTRSVTAVCRDGSYSFDQGHDACGLRGGVQSWRH